ncbi:MAG: acyltransferase [Acidimicrobiales bacterium]
MTRWGDRSDLLVGAYDWFARQAAIGPNSRRSRRFASFGQGSIICFPPATLFGERAIRIGDGTIIAPNVSLSAGIGPDQELLSDRIVEIGHRVLIGRGSSIVGHSNIVVEDDVFFGPNVYVTDQNHGAESPDLPIGRQSAPEAPVRIGWGSWLGTNVAVMPGVTIGRRVSVGAGSVVTRDLPDDCVAVGAPARVVESA